MGNSLKWGIIGPGTIARSIAEAIQGTDGAELYAVASRSMDRAAAFAGEFSIQKAYGSYEEMVADSELDAVFITNLKSQHYEAAKLALNAGKAVVCEKPMTVNAEQLQELVTLAAEKNVFLMKAMWMRFNPNMRKVLEWIREGRIGKVVKIEADFSAAFDETSSLRAPAFGGGALLDLGIYPISLATLIVGRMPDSISSECQLAPSGVDGTDKIVFCWDAGETAELSCSIEEYGEQTARITGTDGYIEIGAPFHAVLFAELNSSHGDEEYQEDFRVNGYEYEIEEAVRCIRSGLKESAVMPLSETVETMKIMDGLRSHWGVVYPFEQ